MPRAEIKFVNQVKACAYAVSVLRTKGVSFYLSAPPQKEVVREMKTSGLVDSEMIPMDYKTVLSWYYEKNKSLIEKRRSEKKKSSKTKKGVKLSTPVIPVATGYVSRCNKDKPLDLTPEVFYKSWRWKELRLIALDVCGRRCVCCGASPSQNNKVTLHVDHIKPLRSNPSLALDLSNLQVLCEDCNQGKSWFNTNDYRTSEQRNEMSRRQAKSLVVTEDAISRMHDKFSA